MSTTENTILGLKLPTDPRWVDLAAISLEEVLTDHAFCEQKAATQAISIIQRYPDKPALVAALAPLVTEEWGHFRMVYAEMRRRGFSLGRQRKDEYVNALQEHMPRDLGPEEKLLHRLLLCALIEARSCERFRILSEGLEEEGLRRFYHKFMVSEAGHYRMFLDLAEEYFGEEKAPAAWREWLGIEAKILQTMMPAATGCTKKSNFAAMTTTVIFDMDGLLLDTESLWGVSMRRVAGKHGIAITPSRFKETTGLRIYEVTEHWARNYPWTGASHNDVAEEILDDIISLSTTSGGVMPGVLTLLDLLDKKRIKIGLATSSPGRMVDALLLHFGLAARFHCVTSADAVSLGKPHPAVFLHCAESLGSAPHECLVLEDSVNGCIAGKAARMKVVAVPDALHFDDPRFTIADLKLCSLEDFDEALLESF